MPARLLFLLCLVLCLPPPCHARVYLRWNAAGRSTRTLTELGGTVAYEARVQVNQGEGDLAVLRFDAPLADTIRRIEHALNAGRFEYGGGAMATALLETPGGKLRVVAVSLPDQGLTLVFKLHQSQAEFDQSRRPPDEVPLEGVPQYPGAEPIFFAADDNTRASLAVSEAPSGPNVVREFYQREMAAAGWAAALPASRRAGEATVTTVYLRENEICCVVIDSSPGDRAARITLLHKKQGMR